MPPRKGEVLELNGRFGELQGKLPGRTQRGFLKGRHYLLGFHIKRIVMLWVFFSQILTAIFCQLAKSCKSWLGNRSTKFAAVGGSSGYEL